MRACGRRPPLSPQTRHHRSPMDVPPADATQHGLFTVSQAMAAGVTRARLRTLLRRGEWRVVDGRVLTAGPRPSDAGQRLRERALAALFRLPVGSLVCGVTAAALYRWERS